MSVIRRKAKVVYNFFGEKMLNNIFQGLGRQLRHLREDEDGN